jgi:hypothetical protein
MAILDSLLDRGETAIDFRLVCISLLFLCIYVLDHEEALLLKVVDHSLKLVFEDRNWLLVLDVLACHKEVLQLSSLPHHLLDFLLILFIILPYQLSFLLQIFFRIQDLQDELLISFPPVNLQVCFPRVHLNFHQLLLKFGNFGIFLLIYRVYLRPLELYNLGFLF